MALFSAIPRSKLWEAWLLLFSPSSFPVASLADTFTLLITDDVGFCPFLTRV